MTPPPSLWRAAKENDVAELERLLAEPNADIDAKDERGYSPLMLAAYNGSMETFSYLLQKGADANSTDAAGNSVLMGATFKGNIAMVRDLLAAGADPTVRNQAGMDAAELATTFGQAEVLDVLKTRTAERGEPR